MLSTIATVYEPLLPYTVTTPLGKCSPMYAWKASSSDVLGTPQIPDTTAQRTVERHAEASTETQDRRRVRKKAESAPFRRVSTWTKSSLPIFVYGSRSRVFVSAVPLSVGAAAGLQLRGDLAHVVKVEHLVRPGVQVVVGVDLAKLGHDHLKKTKAKEGSANGSARRRNRRRKGSRSAV